MSSSAALDAEAAVPRHSLARAAARDGARLALAPLSLVLTTALRRAARLNPDAFDRLGAWREAVFVIAPAEAPVDFDLKPRAVGGAITARPRDPGRRYVARISGPLLALLGVFDGSLDADGAFFRREIRVEGDVEAMITLRNVMDAADLRLSDLVPAPSVLRRPLGRVVDGGFAFARRVIDRAAAS